MFSNVNNVHLRKSQDMREQVLERLPFFPLLWFKTFSGLDNSITRCITIFYFKKKQNTKHKTSENRGKQSSLRNTIAQNLFLHCLLPNCDFCLVFKWLYRQCWGGTSLCPALSSGLWSALPTPVDTALVWAARVRLAGVGPDFGICRRYQQWL